MNCGVPFCQSGILIKGMVTGCPLNNLIPEWNDATYTGNWDEAYNRLRKTNPFPELQVVYVHILVKSDVPVT